ncbi:hypothetical protein JCM5353_000242 [Sporobolomyces roseus]
MSSTTTSPIPPKGSNTTNTTTSPASSSSSPVPPTKLLKPAKKSQKRTRKPLRRRGAKIADEEEEEQSGGSKSKLAGGDSSESDFDPDSGKEEVSDEEEDEEEEDDDPVTPANGGSTVGTAPPTKFDQAQEVTPAAWSDMPQDGEAGSNQLPELDFASLSISKLDALPASTAVPIANGGGLSKKQATLQKKIQKSEELKKKDPEAWERREKERKERDEIKRLAKKERQKEKKRERKVAQKDNKQVDSPAVQNDDPSLPSTTATRPARSTAVPARPSRTALALGLNKQSTEATPDSPSSETSPIPVASTSRQQPAFTSNSRSNVNQQAPRGPRPSLAGAPPTVDYTRAREAYTQRLATDPSYIPKVGKFWGHDDRLASPEVRPLNPFWRGRGGSVTRGNGRGSFRGGRGGFAAAQRGPDRWTAEGKVAGEEGEGTPEEENGGDPKEDSRREKEVKDQGELDSQDKWGRGETKRTQRPSEFASMPGWTHAGFEELEREEEERAARGPTPPTAPRNAGGRAGRGGRGGRGGIAQGPPGTVNPRYAHLPFHPLHRFPPSTLPHSQPTTPPASNPSTPSADTLKPESATTVEPNGTSPQPESRPNPVRLPSSGVAAAHFALALKGATADAARVAEEQTASTPQAEPTETIPPIPSHASALAATENASAELRKQQGASILYAADPSRLSNSAPLDPYQHQIPPHLQQQSQAVPPPPPPSFIPRHSSPAFYPTGPPSFYSNDGYGSMPSPNSATPPPQLYSPHHAPPPSAASFFLPPRSSRIEIKAPSRDGQSPGPKTQNVISSNNTAYAIASQQMEQSNSSVGGVAGSSSPSSTRGGGMPLPPTSPSLMQNPYQQFYSPPPPPQHSAQFAPRSPYEYYPNPYQFQQQQYNPHPLSNGHSFYPQHQQYIDPAILAMGQEGGQRQPQYQQYGIPPPAPY